MTREQVIERGLERIARGDWDDTPDAYMRVKEYAGWLLRQTGNQDDPTPPRAALAASATEPGETPDA